MQENLQRRFQHLWTRCSKSGQGPSEDAVWQQVLERYNEPHRYYHSVGHLCFCLREMDAVADRASNPDALEMAIWFHDAINDPEASDNEAKSEEWFRSLAMEGFDGAFTDQVCQLIRITEHREIPTDPDLQLICDIDLASLGIEWQEFLADCNALRSERMTLSDREFFRRKRAFYEGLLESPHIFFTQYFRKRYEDTARQNIIGYLSLIESEFGSR